MSRTPSYRVQLVVSLAAAVLIVFLTIAAVTAAIGPGPDATELREQQELEEERREQQQELDEDTSGPG